MAFQILELLGSTQGELDVTGEPVSVYLSSGRFTVQTTASNFTGRIIFEGSISEQPSDWFILDTVDHHSYTGSVGQTFKGNLTYIRARQERSHLSILIPQLRNNGYVQRITVSVASVNP